MQTRARILIIREAGCERCKKIGGGGGSGGGKIITRNEGGRVGGWVGARRSNAPHVRLLFAENKLTGLISFHASHLGRAAAAGPFCKSWEGARRASLSFFMLGSVHAMRCERKRARADENINSFAYVLVGRPRPPSRAHAGSQRSLFLYFSLLSFSLHLLLS